MKTMVKYLLFSVLFCTTWSFSFSEFQSTVKGAKQEAPQCSDIAFVKAPHTEIYNRDAGISSEDFSLWKAVASAKNPKKGINNMRELFLAVDPIFQVGTHANKQELKDILMRLDNNSLGNIIQSLLSDPLMLQEIAKRSYSHVMGFSKIVLLEGPSERDYKVRLHIWWPKPNIYGKKLVEEDKHVHKWDFVSRMITGSFEDQLYTLYPSTPEEEKVFHKFTEQLSNMESVEREKIISSVQVLEISFLPQSISNTYLCEEAPGTYYSKEILQKKLSLNDQEFDLLFRVHKKYVTLPNKTGKYGLAAIGLESVSPATIVDVEAGDMYYHRNPIAHRLLSRADQITSTLIITDLPIAEKQPYILMRSDTGEDETKNAPVMKVAELKRQLEDYLKVLRSLAAPNRPK